MKKWGVCADTRRRVRWDCWAVSGCPCCWSPSWPIWTLSETAAAPPILREGKSNGGDIGPLLQMGEAEKLNRFSQRKWLLRNKVPQDWAPRRLLSYQEAQRLWTMMRREQAASWTTLFSAHYWHSSTERQKINLTLAFTPTHLGLSSSCTGTHQPTGGTETSGMTNDRVLQRWRHSIPPSQG